MKRALSEVVRKSKRVKLQKAEVSLVLPERLMGIEIEAEVTSNTSLPRDVAGWQRASDGSLRDGLEYKLAQPLAGDMLAGAIEAMFASAKFERRHTSSCHIHIDILEEEVTEDVLQAMFLLMFMTEEVAYQVGDPGRKWCSFTNQLTYLNVEQIAALVMGQEEFNQKYNAKLGYRNGSDHFSERLQGGSRYIGLNVQAMWKYGSIEFRYFPTPETKEELYNWVNLVQSYMKAAQEVGGREGIESVMSNRSSYEAFISSYFSPWVREFSTHADYDVAKQKLLYALTIADSAVVQDVAVPSVYNVHTRFKRGKANKAEVSEEAMPEEVVVPTPAHQEFTDLGTDGAPPTTEAEARRNAVRRYERWLAGFRAAGGSSPSVDHASEVYNTLVREELQAYRRQLASIASSQMEAAARERQGDRIVNRPAFRFTFSGPAMTWTDAPEDWENTPTVTSSSGRG